MTIFPTDTPTASPTFTLTPSPTPTITPSPAPKKYPCILESEWESSWKGSVTFLNLPCYDFTDEGFVAVEEDGSFILEITHDPGEDLKRSIQHLFPLDSPKVWEVNFSVRFMDADIPAGEIADLFIGLGNPYAINGGTFIVYRYLNQPVVKPINVCIVNSAESECVDTGGDEGVADEFGNYHKFIADMAVGQTHRDIRIVVDDLDGAGYILIWGVQESSLRIREIDQRRLFIGWRLTAGGFVQASIDLNDELLSTVRP